MYWQTSENATLKKDLLEECAVLCDVLCYGGSPDKKKRSTN